MKIEVLRNLKVAQEKEAYNQIAMRQDLTTAQRVQIKHLVSEAKTREAAGASGNFLYTVGGPPRNMWIKKSENIRTNTIRREGEQCK